MTNDIFTRADGVTDNTDELQALIDSSHGALALPAPEKFYLISRALRLPSNFSLVLPRYAEIRLADGSDCHMLEAAEPESRNIEVEGGIWNYNNLGQSKNPYHFPKPERPEYDGMIVSFDNVVGLRLSNMTFKDPVVYAVLFDRVSYFTVENIRFDFNYGNPWATNMDGIHLNGNCHYGTLRNLSGACYDDLVALNCDEGSDGPITHIEIDGLFAEDCHSAVRMLTVKNRLENIHIQNVHGTYFQYCIGLTKYYEGEASGGMDAIVIDNIFASKAERYCVYHKRQHSYVYPLIYIEDQLHVGSLDVRGVYRKERCVEIETFYIGRGTTIDQLRISRVSVEGFTDQKPAPVIRNLGKIGCLSARHVIADRPILDDHGEIGWADIDF